MNKSVNRIEDGKKGEFYGKYCLQFDYTAIYTMYTEAKSMYYAQFNTNNKNNNTSKSTFEEILKDVINGGEEIDVEVVGKVGLDDDDDFEKDNKLFDTDITGDVKIFMDKDDLAEFALLYARSGIHTYIRALSTDWKEDEKRVRGVLKNQVFHLTIEGNGEKKRIPVKIITNFFPANQTIKKIRLVVDKAEETVEPISRIEEREEGGAPSRKSRRTRKSRKSHKSHQTRKSSKKSGRKSNRRTRR